MGAPSSLDLAYDHQFTSLSFIFVLAPGVAVLKESLGVGKVGRILLTCCGLIAGSRWP